MVAKRRQFNSIKRTPLAFPMVVGSQAFMLAMRLLVGRLSTGGGACYDYLNQFFISVDQRAVTRALNLVKKFTSRSVRVFVGSCNGTYRFVDIVEKPMF